MLQDLSADGGGDDWSNHLVNSEQICLSRDEGNLCIVNVVAKNLSAGKVGLAHFLGNGLPLTHRDQ